MVETATQTDSSNVPELAGILAEFGGAAALKAAAVGVREAGYRRMEAYSPFPVHGIDAALGRRRTRLPWLVLGGGVAGGVVALVLQWWTNAVDYPYLISGKPLWSLPANVPIVFELIVLLAALAAFGGGLVLSGLPEWFHPLFGSVRFRRATTDGFFLAIDAADGQFDPVATTAVLEGLGAKVVELVPRPEDRRRLPGILVAGVAVLVAVALLPPLWLARGRFVRKSAPRVHLIKDMDFQEKYLPQQAVAETLFADGRAMRPPVAGTIAADDAVGDWSRLLQGEVDGEPVESFPIAVTAELAERGQERFGIYCATCHGLAGDGDGITAVLAEEREDAAWVRPLSLHNPSVTGQAVGQLFTTISEGVRTMPSYGSQIGPEDRWAIVLYVRALQRMRSATIEDVPPLERATVESMLTQ